MIQYEHPGADTIDGLADHVVSLLDHQGVGRAFFVGLSLGGMVGMNLAARYPDRVDRLVLACTTAHLPPPEGTNTPRTAE